MCFERQWRDQEAEESRRMWMDLERTQPAAEPPADAEPVAGTDEVREEVEAPLSR